VYGRLGNRCAGTWVTACGDMGYISRGLFPASRHLSFSSPRPAPTAVRGKSLALCSANCPVPFSAANAAVRLKCAELSHRLLYSSPRRRPGPRASVSARAPTPHKSFKTWAIIAKTVLTALGPGLRRGDDEQDKSRGEHPAFLPAEGKKYFPRIAAGLRRGDEDEAAGDDDDGRGDDAERRYRGGTSALASSPART
jgi:hypothetical protein